jgi:hypothetical protein
MTRLSYNNSRVNSMDEPFVVNVFRRHGSIGGFPLILICLRCIMAHDAELRVAKNI